MSPLPVSPYDAGIGGIFGRGPSWLPQGAAFGQQPQGGFMNGLKGLLGNPDLAMALLANSGYSPQKRSFGEILGTSMLQANQAKQGRADDELMSRYREAQIKQLEAPGAASRAKSIEEYEYAVKNGYKGSFQDWTVMGGQSSRPSSVQEWEFFDKLTADQQKRYLEMKRNPNWKVGDVNQVPTVIQGLPGGGVQTTPLSTLPQVASSAETVKTAEGRGGAVGKIQGEVTGGIIKKGSDAKSTVTTLDIADPLIDAATGSALGAGRDKLAAFFGAAPDSAQAIAQLRVLQANLMTAMPRMEGPQSDRDVELYRQAAGQIGDPTVPAPLKKAAVRTIRELQQRYMERAEGLRQTGEKPKETAAERAKRLGL